ncbi:MAG: glutathione-disulfide reductase [Bauldia sp.]
MPTHDYDLFVIGGGSGGVRAARISGRHGAKVGLTEESRIGGTCVIRGCVPKKLMVYAARFRDAFEDSVGFGWSPVSPSFDWPKLIRNKDKEVDRLNAAYIRGLESAKVDIFAERAVLNSPNSVRLAGGREVSAKHILIATGGRPNLETSLPGIEHAITSDEMFQLPALPERILIVGASYVAVEFASIMSGLGAKVTVLHRGEEILRSFDADVRKLMHEAMAKRGIEVVLNDHLARIEKTAAGLVATTEAGTAIAADQVLMAIGRVPNTGGLGLPEIGVELDDAGAVIVDSHSQTTVPSIYAIGDVANRVNLTPVAIREGHVLADHLFGTAKAVVDHLNVPHAVFGIPEIGVVGMTEETAVEHHEAVDVYQANFRPMRHDLSGRDERVFMKLVVDAATDRLLGFHTIGGDGAELAQLMAVIIKMKGKKSDLDATMALHPTSAEEIVTMREPVRRHRR